MLKTGTVHAGRGRSPLVGLAGPIRRDKRADYDSISRSLVAYLRLRLPVPFLADTGILGDISMWYYSVDRL